MRPLAVMWTLLGKFCSVCFVAFGLADEADGKELAEGEVGLEVS